MWQSRIMISWGVALLAHVGVSNKEGIYATRFLLGLVRDDAPGAPTASMLIMTTVRSWNVPRRHPSDVLLVQTGRNVDETPLLL